MTRGGACCASSGRGSGSVVTWRRAQMVLLSAQGMDVAAIAKVAFTSEDRSDSRRYRAPNAPRTVWPVAGQEAVCRDEWHARF